MGTWGTAIFSDDTAADVRDAFRDYVSEGLSSEEATSRVKKDFAETIQDRNESIVFWLALAATQWKTGRLLEMVKTRALEIISSEADLERWRDSSAREIGAREKHLSKLRDQLLSPQPAAKKLRRRRKSSTDFEQGDIAIFQIDERLKVRFCVLYLWGDRGGTYAHICLLGIDDGKPFDRDSLTLEETLAPHFTMLSHEPKDSITLLRRSVRVPERNRDAFAAWNRIAIRGHACTWKAFPSALHEILPKLGWI